MSKLTEAYRTVGVFNAYEFARDKGRIWIGYTPNDYGRAGRSACWHVYGRDIQTDPKAHWQDNGSKWFGFLGAKGRNHSERKRSVLLLAQKWASEKYGIKKWARTPFGDWMEAEFVRSRVAELAERIKAARSAA